MSDLPIDPELGSAADLLSFAASDVEKTCVEDAIVRYVKTTFPVEQEA